MGWAEALVRTALQFLSFFCSVLFLLLPTRCILQALPGEPTPKTVLTVGPGDRGWSCAHFVRETHEAQMDLRSP